MASPGLSALFHLDSPFTFLETHWPDQLLVARGPINRLAGLVDYDFGALTEMRKRGTRAFFHSTDGQPRVIDVARGQERALYDAGFTIYFIGLRAPGIDAWVDALGRELGLVPGASPVSAFASRRGPGLKPHYDANNNFVCQAQGVKRWRTAANTHVRNPTLAYAVGTKVEPKHEAEAPNGLPTDLPTPFETVDLDPGAVMFLPCGTWHDTETISDASLHFDIECNLPRWKDLVEFALLGTTALHAESLRGPLLDVLSAPEKPDRFREGLAARLHELVDAICEGDALRDRDAFLRFVARRRTG